MRTSDLNFGSDPTWGILSRKGFKMVKLTKPLKGRRNTGQGRVPLPAWFISSSQRAKKLQKFRELLVINSASEVDDSWENARSHCKIFHLLKSGRSHYLVSTSLLLSKSHTNVSWWNLNWETTVRDAGKCNCQIPSPCDRGRVKRREWSWYTGEKQESIWGIIEPSRWRWEVSSCISKLKFRGDQGLEI